MRIAEWGKGKWFEAVDLDALCVCGHPYGYHHANSSACTEYLASDEAGRSGAPCLCRKARVPLVRLGSAA